MNLDITFCSRKKCKNIKCDRNQRHLKGEIKEYIRITKHPISIANFEECEHWKEKK